MHYRLLVPIGVSSAVSCNSLIALDNHGLGKSLRDPAHCSKCERARESLWRGERIVAYLPAPIFKESIIFFSFRLRGSSRLSMGPNRLKARLSHAGFFFCQNSPA
jgi:hypothetical protein